MRGYMMQSHGSDFGPYLLEFLRTKLAAAEFDPRTSADVVEDGKQVVYSTVGEVIVADDSLANAFDTFQSYLAKSKERADRSPDFEPAQYKLAFGYEGLGHVLALQGKVDEAITNYRAALAVMEKLARQNRRNEQLQTDIAELNYNLAVHGDEPARRYAVVLETVQRLQSRSHRREAQLLAKAEAALAKLTQP